MTGMASSMPMRVWCAIAVASLTLGLGGCGQKSADTTTSQATTTDAPAASTDAFPAGTELGDLGLPVYPVPKSTIEINPAETNADGVKSESMTLQPHAPFATVVAWYKARMPSDSAQPSSDPDHAQFNIGKYGDKVVRMVMIDHITGHDDTHLVLIKQTTP